MDGVFEMWLPNALYGGTKISFVRHVNGLFMKYGSPSKALGDLLLQRNGDFVAM